MTYYVTIVLVKTISSALLIILATFDVNHFRQEIKSRYQEKRNDKLYRLSNADSFWPQNIKKGERLHLKCFR